MNKVLDWYQEMGVDEVVSEAPVNRTKKIEKTAAAPANIDLPKLDLPKASDDKVLFVAESAAKFVGPASTAQNTRQLADAASDLSALADAVRSFKGISITKTATNTVFADGNAESDIMMIGEAPGAEEDVQGIPFCGASGKMLDQIFSYIGLFREKNFYITNTLFWRPPGNRRPTPEELEICRPFVEKHIALVKPKLIILVGGTAVASLLGPQHSISKIRGKFFEYTNPYLDGDIKVTAVFHPSFLLRSPGQKKFAWLDALNIKHYIRDNGVRV